MTSTRIASDSRERATSVPLPTGGAILSLIGILLSAIMLLTVALSAEARADVKGATSIPQADRQDMVLIPGGEFVMGNEGAYADESPLHTVRVSAFYIDEHEVTNAQFSAFVKATGYVTKAERDGRCWAYLVGETDWQYAAGTDWRHPQGPESTIDDKLNHPVVCVSWDDVVAYAKWAGKRLPTEAEWEYVARAGTLDHLIARTESPNPGHGHQTAGVNTLAAVDRLPSSKSHAEGSHQQISAGRNHEVTVEANIWQGHWPEYNQLDDGFYYTAPIASFEANGMGIYDMLGNVWEWTADWYDSSYYAVSPTSNPQGPQTGENRVARGDSWFCSLNYCGAYSTHYRGASPPDHAFNNVGFRCAKDTPKNTK